MSELTPDDMAQLDSAAAFTGSRAEPMDLSVPDREKDIMDNDYVLAELIRGVREGGYSVQIAGVRIHPCDTRGNDLTRPANEGALHRAWEIGYNAGWSDGVSNTERLSENPYAVGGPRE